MKIFIPFLPHTLNRLLSMQWAKRASYTKKMHQIVRSYIRLCHPTTPLTVTLCRVSKRACDDDGLVGSFKSVRDAVAMHIFPGTKSGQADNNPLVTWQYTQEIAKKDQETGFYVIFES